MTTIPNPPRLGDTFTNEVTGVTYEYDGEKWIVIGTPGSEEVEQISEDLTALTTRVSDGEAIQRNILERLDSVVGGNFQTKYDGDYTTLSVGGNSHVMNSGEVMYLDAAFNITTNPINVSIIGFAEEDFNWDTCITSGIIMVRAASLDAGAYQVWKLRKRTGKHVQLWVEPIWTDTGHPLNPGTTRCFFQGVFFE